MYDRTNTYAIASLLRRLDTGLSAYDAAYIARQTYGPVKVLSRGSDPRLYLAGRLDRLPDGHSWYSVGDLMWRAMRILRRTQLVK